MPLASLRRDRLRQLWADPDMFATSLLILFVDHYGTEGLTWASETIKMEVEQDAGVTIPRGNFDRLMVARDIITSDNFYRSLPDFIAWCNILSGDSYDPRVWDPADAGEIAWGITEAIVMEPPEDEEPFTDEIRAYIGAVLDSEGIINPPDVLRIAIRDTRRIAGTVPGDFSDDPAMFSGVYGFEQEKTDEINNYVKSSLVRLGEQLNTLPLDTGSTKDVVQKVLRAL